MLFVRSACCGWRVHIPRGAVTLFTKDRGGAIVVVRFGMKRVTVMLLFFALSSQVHAEAPQPSDLKILIRGCWNYEELQYPDAPSGTPELISFQIACFNEKGVVTGLTFHDGDGWDWIYDYLLENDSLVVGGTSWGRILDASATKLLLIAGDKLRAYNIVCRTPEEDVQCERLQYKSTDQANFSFARKDSVGSAGSASTATLPIEMKARVSMDHSGR
jgi:hypothetical protein